MLERNYYIKRNLPVLRVEMGYLGPDFARFKFGLIKKL